MSHHRAKVVRHAMRKIGIEITSKVGRKRYQHAKKIAREVGR